MKFSYLAVLAFTSVVLGQQVYVSEINRNKCMDVESIGAGYHVTTEFCNGSDSQQWVAIDSHAPEIHNFADKNLCIDAGNSPGPGTLLTIEMCNNPSRPGQRFRLSEVDDHIRLEATDFCIAKADPIHDSPLELRRCDKKDPHQIWNHAHLHCKA